MSKIAFPYSELLGSLSSGNLFCLFVQISVYSIKTVSLSPPAFGVCQLSIQFKLGYFLIVEEEKK